MFGQILFSQHTPVLFGCYVSTLHAVCPVVVAYTANGKGGMYVLTQMPNHYNNDCIHMSIMHCACMLIFGRSRYRYVYCQVFN